MYWWANQNQTWKPEINGGYLWSPQIKRDGTRNPFYETMRRADAGDVVFSFYDQRINHVGIVQRPAVACPRPDEFGAIGQQWDRAGWLIEVAWKPVPTFFRPKEHMDQLRPTLPSKYSPLNSDGNGSQSVYLAAVPRQMGETLLALGGLEPSQGSIGDKFEATTSAVEAAEQAIIEHIQQDDLSDTEKRSLVLSRLGQGRYRQNLEMVEQGCRITGVRDRRLLRASHIKPWRACDTSAERLDGNNGMLLAPHIDLLFDRGYITFENNSSLVLSEAIPAPELCLLAPGLTAGTAVGSFNSRQQHYLAYHRENVFFRRAASERSDSSGGSAES